MCDLASPLTELKLKVAGRAREREADIRCLNLGTRRGESSYVNYLRRHVNGGLVLMETGLCGLRAGGLTATKWPAVVVVLHRTWVKEHEKTEAGSQRWLYQKFSVSLRLG